MLKAYWPFLVEYTLRRMGINTFDLCCAGVVTQELQTSMQTMKPQPYKRLGGVGRGEGVVGGGRGE